MLPCQSWLFVQFFVFRGRQNPPSLNLSEYRSVSRFEAVRDHFEAVRSRFKAVRSRFEAIRGHVKPFEVILKPLGGPFEAV